MKFRRKKIFQIVPPSDNNTDDDQDRNDRPLSQIFFGPSTSWCEIFGGR